MTTHEQVRLINTLARLSPAPVQAAGATLGVVFLLTRRRGEHPATAGTVLHRRAVDCGYGELSVRGADQVGRVLGEQEVEGFPPREVRSERRGDAQVAALQLIEIISAIRRLENSIRASSSFVISSSSRAE